MHLLTEGAAIAAAGHTEGPAITAATLLLCSLPRTAQVGKEPAAGLCMADCRGSGYLASERDSKLQQQC